MWSAQASKRTAAQLIRAHKDCRENQLRGCSAGGLESDLPGVFLSSMHIQHRILNISGFPAHTRELSLDIGKASSIDDVDANAWELFATDCGLTASPVKRTVRGLAEAMMEALEPTIAKVIEQYPAAEQASVTFREGVLAQISKVR
jgi:hypothetical protein